MGKQFFYSSKSHRALTSQQAARYERRRVRAAPLAFRRPWTIIELLRGHKPDWRSR